MSIMTQWVFEPGASKSYSKYCNALLNSYPICSACKFINCLASELNITLNTPIHKLVLKYFPFPLRKEIIIRINKSAVLTSEFCSDVLQINLAVHATFFYGGTTVFLVHQSVGNYSQGQCLDSSWQPDPYWGFQRFSLHFRLSERKPSCIWGMFCCTLLCLVMCISRLSENIQ